MPKSERAAVSLPAFLEKKLNFVQPLLDQKHVDLSRTFDPNLPPVQVDAEQLWEAILNLIRNAVDAMPDGGSLTVSAQRHGAEALLSISDNGRGMTEEEARLFLSHSLPQRAMARASVSHTRSGSSMNMAGRLIALRRGEKAALLAFNFRWLLVRDMTISLFQLSDPRAWVFLGAGRFGASPDAILLERLWTT